MNSMCVSAVVLRTAPCGGGKAVLPLVDVCNVPIVNAASLLVVTIQEGLAGPPLPRAKAAQRSGNVCIFLCVCVCVCTPQLLTPVCRCT